jgi:hypothetical protein
MYVMVGTAHRAPRNAADDSALARTPGALRTSAACARWHARRLADKQGTHAVIDERHGFAAT